MNYLKYGKYGSLGPSTVKSSCSEKIISVNSYSSCYSLKYNQLNIKAKNSNFYFVFENFHRCSNNPISLKTKICFSPVLNSKTRCFSKKREKLLRI